MKETSEKILHGIAITVGAAVPWAAGARQRVLLIARAMLPVILVLVAACSRGQDMSSTDLTTEAEGEQPLRKLNPAPKSAYVITMTIANAPGRFDSVEGTAQYTVENSAECGEEVPIAGAFPRISTNEPFALDRVSETEYRGTVYADLVLDEDYFGRGVCRWSFVEARVRLRATTDEKDTRFVPSLAAENVRSAKSETWFFWRKGYPRETAYDGFADFGKTSPGAFKPELRDELFSATLKAREVRI